MESWLARFNSERLTRAKEKRKERAENNKGKEKGRKMKEGEVRKR
jgi:hypothetical protein